MDDMFNSEGAAAALGKLIGERRLSAVSGFQISKLFEGEGSSDFRVASVGGIGRLVHDAEEEGSEEVVMSFQGIILRKELPPILDKSVASRPRFLRQGLSLTGLGDQAFDEIVTKIARAHGLFKRSLGDQLLDSSVFSAFKDFNTVDMGNRYFTSRSEAANDDIVKMESDVDPLGILQKAAGGDLVHCEDNQVLYFEKQIRKELSDYEFKKVSPAIFQIGDLVEVQVSMVALPQRGAKAKASLILRSISLMDSRFSQEALVRKLTPTDKPKEAQRTGLKRKVGYGEEQLSVARAKLTAMDIDADRGGNKGADVTNS